MKILIAEDEPNTVQHYKVLLESQGYGIISTSDGESCLQVYKSALTESPKQKRRAPPFKVVILDVRMPKLEGVQLAKQILSMCPKQRIIMATAYSRESIKGLVNHLENVDILQKPFDLGMFLELIQRPSQRLPTI